MRKTVLILFIFALCGVVGAQEATPEVTAEPTTEEAPVYTLNVFVDSLIIRALPTEDSEFAASAFEGEILNAVGRNADGTWFQVKRPLRDGILGWVPRQFVGFNFEVAQLPITDLTTGVTGPEPVFDSGVSVFILTEAALRPAPNTNAERIGVVPITITVPVIERSPDNRWLLVNYLGTVGWIAEFLTSTSADLDQVPISSAFEFEIVSLEVIPVEVQLAQLNRLRDYIFPLLETSNSTASFWLVVQSGEVVPCEPPPGNYAAFSLTPRDVVELPELRRYTRQLQTALNSLNNSVAIMQPCGVFTDEQISEAYAGAINARSIYNALLDNLDNLEEIILD